MNEKQNLAVDFINGLTREEFENFINTLFSTLPTDELMNVFEQLDDSENIINLYRQINNSAEQQAESLAPSTDDKFIEIWSSLVSGIDCIIGDIGDEDGEYVEQGKHWECPEFDEFQAARDMDEIFEKMLPLLEKVDLLKIEEEDIFLNMLGDINDNIGMYPEWMGAEYNEFAFEEKGAECVLKWMWLNSVSVESFVKGAVEAFKHSMLPLNFSPVFFTKESNEKLNELYNILLKESEQYSEIDLSNTDCFWHIIFHQSEKVADSNAYLKTAEDLIGQEWTYGIPVYENYIKLKDFKQAEHYCERTLAEAYRQTYNYIKNFNTNPEQSIFATHSDKKDERIERAFFNWKLCCEELNMHDKLLLIDIQQQFYQTPDNWDEIKLKLLPAKTQSWFYDIMEAWKHYVIINTLEYQAHSTPNESWIGWLIDYIVNDDAKLFQSKTENWLKSEMDEPDSFRHGVDFSLLYQLTRDVLGNDKSIDTFQVFKAYINKSQNRVYNFREKIKLDDQYRLAYLQNSNASILKDKILQAWRGKIHQFITSPEHVAKSDYSSSAKWLAITKELNKELFKQIHAEWKSCYWRKRNLWKALKQYGIAK